MCVCVSVYVCVGLCLCAHICLCVCVGGHACQEMNLVAQRFEVLWKHKNSDDADLLNNLNSSQMRGQLSLDVIPEEKAVRKAFLTKVIFPWNMVFSAAWYRRRGEEMGGGVPVRLCRARRPRLKSLGFIVQKVKVKPSFTAVYYVPRTGGIQLSYISYAHQLINSCQRNQSQSCVISGQSR